MEKEFERLHKYVIIIKPTICDEIEDSKRRSIKRIMAIVDTQITNATIHGHIRKAVLDSINDLTRAFAITLDRVVEKIEPTLEPSQNGFSMGSPRCQECDEPADLNSVYCPEHRRIV
jgi:hypothetical protein